MTERFKELLPNPFSVDYQHPHDGFGFDLYDEKRMLEFGANIVRKCMMQIVTVWIQEQKSHPSCNDVINAIQKHFELE